MGRVLGESEGAVYAHGGAGRVCRGAVTKRAAGVWSGKGCSRPAVVQAVLTGVEQNRSNCPQQVQPLSVDWKVGCFQHTVEVSQRQKQADLPGLG